MPSEKFKYIQYQHVVYFSNIFPVLQYRNMLNKYAVRDYIRHRKCTNSFTTVNSIKTKHYYDITLLWDVNKK